MKLAPGPLPSSCLTCRQRKKKCDKVQPACTACLDGGFQCLGYDHIPQSTPPPSSVKGTTSLRRLAPKISQLSVQELDPTTDNRLVKNDQPSSTFTNGAPGPRPSDTDPIYRMILPSPSTTSQVPRPDHSPFTSPSHSGVQTQTQPSPLLISQQRPLTTAPVRLPLLEVDSPDLASSRKFPPGSPPFASGELGQSARRLSGISQECFDLSVLFSLPPRICPDPVTSGKFIEFILSQYEPLLELVFFRSARACLDLARKGIVMRLRLSSLTRWSMYVGARIFQVLTKDGKRADLRYLRSCLRRLDQHICVKSINESSIDELVYSLSSGLELVFLNFLTSNAQAGYTLLKNLVPIFLQLAFTDINLFSHQLDPSSTGISFSHALVASVLEVRRFVFIDTIASLAFGVPPVIEYDMSFPPMDPPNLPGLENEWADEFIPEFTCLLAKVNVWRARNPGKPAAESDWKSLEAQAWGYEWGAERDMKRKREGLEVIWWRAILEGWRHAALIYLYMGMCGFTSDDRRVQSSVRQIMKLLGVLRQDWSTKTHFFVPCLMACICTPHEKHRAVLSDVFLGVEDTQPWLFKALDYKPVIDHLWHGAAAHGRPVRWEEFVDSRKAMLPIT